MNVSRVALVGIVGGVLAAAGTVLPWISASARLVGTISRSGLELVDLDSIIILAIGVGGALLCLWGKQNGFALAFAGAVIAGWLGWSDYQQVAERVKSADTGVIISV